MLLSVHYISIAYQLISSRFTDCLGGGNIINLQIELIPSYKENSDRFSYVV